MRESELPDSRSLISFLWNDDDERIVLSVSDDISLLGYSPEDFSEGKKFADIVHPSDVRMLNESYVQFRKDNEASFFSAKYRVRSSDGMTCEVIERTFKVFQDGKYLFHGIISPEENFGSVPDVEAERKYCKGIVDSIKHPLLILDSTFHVVSANRYFYEMFKLKVEDTQGKNFLASIPVIGRRSIHFLKMS